jgi:Spy/CpxP family protein refolding chaperone
MKRGSLALVCVVLAAAYGFGQNTTPQKLDPMKRALVEPIMALEFAQEIGLSRTQKTQIEIELKEARTKFRLLEERLRSETKKMHELLERPGVTEREALDQLEQVLQLEKQIKQVNLLCSLHVRAQLRPDQREKLLSLPVPPPPPPPPPPHAPAPPPPARAPEAAPGL